MDEPRIDLDLALRGLPRNYHGYHLTADAKGCVFLLGLIELFRNAQYPARKVVELTIPTPDHLAIPNCPRKCIPARTAEFRFRRDYSESHWSIIETDGKVSIETGANALCELDRGFADVTVHKGIGLLEMGTTHSGSGGTLTLTEVQNPKDSFGR